MLSEETKEKLLQNLREMSAEEMVTIFKKIGSRKLKPGEKCVPIDKFLDEEMRRYLGPYWKSYVS